MRVLIVEDEPLMAEGIRDGLRLEAIAADIAADGTAALGLLRLNDYDIAVLDRDIPGPTGDEIAERIVASGSGMPILMLTAADRIDDKATGFELGADDYLTKPFSPRELAIRVRNLMRRTAPKAIAEREQTVAFGDVVVDPTAREAHKGGEPLRLTLKELDLLLFFASNPRQVFSRDQLMDRVWGYQNALDTGTVTVHVRRLRKKIEDDASRPRHLETVFGSGYRFTP
jgi:two-component system response regulator VanR